MKDQLKVSGYPLSQVFISGGFAAFSVSLVVVLLAMAKPIPPVVFIFAGGMVAVALWALLATPIIRLTADPNADDLLVTWVSFGGLVRRTNSLQISRIRKLVYGVTTLKSTSGSKHSYQSRHSFYAQMSDGTHIHLSPKSQATAGLSRKLGKALSEHLDLVFVRRSGGMGKFDEEPMTREG